MSESLAREQILADPALVGGVFCRSYSRRVDEWLAALFDRQRPDHDRVALVAVGGYGRSELSPGSDIDVVLLHERGFTVDRLAEQLWYPIWDEGLKLGHSVRTVKESLVLASEDLDTATSLLSCRLIAGSVELTRRLSDSATAQWRKQATRWLPILSDRTKERHRVHGEVAFLLEPNLKDGRGGLRDMHTLWWMATARDFVPDDEQLGLKQAYETLLAARVELHRATGRQSDRLLLEDQDAVAAALGDADADVLMHRISAAARSIAWVGDGAWKQVAGERRRFRRSETTTRVGRGIERSSSSVAVSDDADLTDPTLALRVAAAAATAGVYIDRGSLRILVDQQIELGDPWPDGARDAFVQLLSAGPTTVDVVETLDQVGLFTRWIPEWEPCRSRVQRNAYHRFTVDRHLIESAVEAARLADRVDRPDLLVVGAFLHDIGKGYPGDHTQVGMELIPTIAARMGFADADIATLTDLCEHHLLLPDFATRRDLSDPATSRSVAAQVGDTSTLALLAALTEADSVATGPAAWSGWKADLVADLVHRATIVLDGGDLAEIGPVFPTEAQRTMMSAGAERYDAEDLTITVAAPDRPGLLSRTAGVLALHGLDVLQADVTSEDGTALQSFLVESPFQTDIDWKPVLIDIEAALAGRLAVHARLLERIRTYESTPAPRAPRPIVETQVSIDNDLSPAATVIEVHAPDGIGLLHRLTEALSQLDLNITSAKVQTLGDHVVDSFYVRTPAGEKVLDNGYLAEIERALLTAIPAPAA